MEPEVTRAPRVTHRPEGDFGLWQRLKNRPVQYLLDVSMLASAFFAAYAIRFEFTLPAEVFARCFRQLPLVVLFQFGTLSVCGVYFFIWRYIGMAEVKVFLKAAVLATGPLVLMRIALPSSLQDFRVPL